MFVSSSDFKTDSPIPKKFSGEGENVSPRIEWKDVPADCKELALVCEDPDASDDKEHPFVHWLVYNISTDENSLHTALPQDRVLTDPFHVYQGLNSLNKLGYCGPMPPEGHGEHNYIFTLYALSTELHLDPGLSVKEVLPNIKKYTIDKAQVIGTYERPLRRTDVSKNKSKEEDSSKGYEISQSANP